MEACTQSGVMLSVGHVLRYDPVIHKIKVKILISVLIIVTVECCLLLKHKGSIFFQELIDAGVVGDVIHIQHLEPVRMLLNLSSHTLLYVTYIQMTGHAFLP